MRFHPGGGPVRPGKYALTDRMGVGGLGIERRLKQRKPAGTLAKSRTPADRERLLLGIVALCDAGDGAAALGSPPIQALLNSIFPGPRVVGAERGEILRRKAARREARSPRTGGRPPALVNVLALDDIEIARPIIAMSPVLQDRDLVRLLVEATIEHQIEVAAAARTAWRGGWSPRSCKTPNRASAVMTALAGNPTADLQDLRTSAPWWTPPGEIAALRSPMSRHPKLTDEPGAAPLHIHWVGQAPAANPFPTGSDSIPGPGGAGARRRRCRRRYGSAPTSGQGMVILARDGEREAMEQRLIDKLHAAGQLRPGYLVRVLQEGRLSLFTTALRRPRPLRDRPCAADHRSDRPELLGLACAAVGIDRGAFPTILELVRKLNGGRPRRRRGRRTSARSAPSDRSAPRSRGRRSARRPAV